jgi:hypothetical protein
MVSLVSGGGFKGAAGFAGQGFRVEFERDPGPGPYAAMVDQGIAVRGASVEAVVKTTTEIKERIRDYIDANFGGSAFTRNNRRRMSNAAAQAKFYDELEDKGQYAGLVYSKLGKGHGPGGFVDFLLTHVRGGTLTPKSGEWLRIPVRGVAGSFLARTGTFADAGSRVFFVPSRDGQKLYLMRRYGGAASGVLAGSMQLLATFVKAVTLPASLSGIQDIANQRPLLFEGYFGAALERMQQSSGASTAPA